MNLLETNFLWLTEIDFADQSKADVSRGSTYATPSHKYLVASSPTELASPIPILQVCQTRSLFHTEIPLGIAAIHKPRTCLDLDLVHQLYYAIKSEIYNHVLTDLFYLQAGASSTLPSEH